MRNLIAGPGGVRGVEWGGGAAASTPQKKEKKES